ncbi:MAG: hypothetical protein KDA51_19865, partial [Planctomycetales bacterium]|nr:hypothetical protein [Planctomycetales bacterium]
RGEFATQEVKHQLGSAEARAQSAYLQSRAALRQLNSQLTYQAQVLEVLKKALADSQRLIEILEAQRLIGEIDSLNFTTAFINSVTLRQSMLDAWGAVQKGVFAHHIYERWVNTASRDTAYRHPQLRLRAN